MGLHYMEFTVLEEDKKRIVFELDSDHGFCTLLKKELYNDKNVVVATYNVEHPLVSRPKFIVEVSSGKPKDALKKAAERLKKEIKTFKDGVKSLK
jgi:DNA-directed RNA polymerase subunit L